ncbi:prenyltransferase/squalene oxidase repeat-containing protein [uncultured Jatrophihabitans sp.]|uniref:prenyltransferase/squalene oxidase repeat-containing protein n=1 Tax=uncultured Jatrophihabitans sp. TaxID=1610747 RepID=UPI0035CA185B
MRMKTPSRWLAVGTASVLALAGASVATAAPSAAKTHKVSTHTSLSNGRAVAGRPVTLAAAVHPNPHGGTVRFRNGASTVHGCSAVHLHSGKAVCHAKLTAGSRSLRASFSGHKRFRASSVRRTVRVATAPKPTARPAPAKTAPTKPTAVKTFLGSLGSCTTTKGALVAVDFAHWSGPAVRGCDPAPTTGIKLLTTAGFTTAGDQHDGPQFICRIGHPLYNKGTQYPTPAQDPCVVTPPASAYWSFWLAPKGSNTWSYSQYGAYADKPTNGEVEAWTFGGTDIAGTHGQPAFAPNDVRAGLPTGTATAERAAQHAQVRRAKVRVLDAGAATPNLTKAADYLTRQLVDGDHYEPFGPGSKDIGLTIDGGLALASFGSADESLGAIADYVSAHVGDYTFLGTQYAAQYADGGSIGKVALLAESVGRNPRSFGGFDLIKEIESRVCVKADATIGCAGAGNYRNANTTFKQALGLIAQLRAGDGKSAERPAAYLEGTQHADGSFSSIIPTTGDSETDSTGMAAMGLALVPGSKARAALAKALRWLAGQQESSGGFPGASGDSVNSAAIVVQALRLDAQTYNTQIVKAEKFLTAEQNTDGGFNVASNTTGSDLRASTQALGGAVGTPFGSVLDNLTAKSGAVKGAGYLVSQLQGTGNDHYVFAGSSSADDGLTSDGVFALLAAGGHDADVTKMVTWLEGDVANYADPAGAEGGPYSGGLSKLALVAEATGNDPHAFGGTDLLGLVKSKVCSAKIDGDFSPCTAAGDAYNAFSTVSQALAVLALQASPNDADHLTIDSPLVVRLHQLQCADGGFSSVLITPGQKCTSEVDTTGYAVQALAAVQGTDTWLGAAQKYLEKAQLSSGLYNGAVKSSSNSTALAAGALQSLVDALTSPTADPPQPKTIAPIAAWQSALTGLTTTAVSSGGFQTSPSASGADLRASTQAVAAAAQRSLLAESGARVLSLPRAADATAPPASGTTTPPSSTAPGSGSSSPTAADSAPGGGSSAGTDATTQSSSELASTGLDSMKLLFWALVLMVLGVGLSLAGRRGLRVPQRTARHR